MEELDFRPELLHAVQPPAPPAGSIDEGSATIVFSIFIDPEGYVRIPIIQDTGNGKVDLQVLESLQRALTQWRFSSPTVEGRPVMAQVEQSFELKDAATMGPVR